MFLDLMKSFLIICGYTQLSCHVNAFSLLCGVLTDFLVRSEGEAASMPQEARSRQAVLKIEVTQKDFHPSL